MKKHTGLTKYQEKRLMLMLEKLLGVEVIYINSGANHVSLSIEVSPEVR